MTLVSESGYNLYKQVNKTTTEIWKWVDDRTSMTSLYIQYIWFISPLEVIHLLGQSY